MDIMLKKEIAALVENAAGNLGLFIYEFSVIQKDENSNIMVKIDSLSGISHEDCRNYSGELARLLDEANIAANYTLEISSPGINRKLRGVEEFRRFINAPVKIVYEVSGKRDVLKGIITKVDGDDVYVKKGAGNFIISYSTIKKANLDY